MFTLSLIEQLNRFLRTRTGRPGVARNLLERAEALGGQNPHEARDLRRSALAYLSVIR